MTKFLNLLIILILLPSTSLACSTSISDKILGGRGKCVDVGGYQLYVRTFGRSTPVVIFDSGSGDDSSVWNKVAPEVSKFARVVVYDRAGLGKSDVKPGNNPITSQDAIDALKRLLNKENIKPPYFLVGHSRGGLNMQLFAEKYPNEIAGIVLIDSVSRDQNFHDPLPPKSSHSYRETAPFDEDREQVRNAGSFPSIPLIVLTATNHHDSIQQEELWQEWQRGIVKLSPKAFQIFAWGSGHYIQKQQPQLVINAIYTIIELNTQPSKTKVLKNMYPSHQV